MTHGLALVTKGLTGGAAAEPSSPRRPDVQGLRAVAVLLVVAHHAGMPLPGGFVGVDIFFVISGFVITGMLRRELEAHGRIRFGRFYVRRLKRLTPALALMVSMTVLVSTLFLSPLGPQQATAQTAVGAMFVVANAVIARTTGDYFDGPAESNALLHTWSLSVEEQFYLVFPLLLAFSWALARRRGWSARWVPSVVVALVAGVSLSIAVAVSRGLELQVGEMLVGFYGPVTRVWEFGVGALLALVPATSRAPGRGGRAQAVAGGLLLVASVGLISGETPFPGPWTLLPVAGTALLISAGAGCEHVLARLLRSTPMVKVGDWSYSIYLWHWPFIVFASALWPGRPRVVLLAVLLSFLPAVASHVWVEEPIRTMNLEPGGFRRLVALSVVPPVAAALLLGIAASRGFWSSVVNEHQNSVLKEHQGCSLYTALTTDTAEGCTWNGDAQGSPIYLVGDSHALHFSEALIAVGEDLDRPVVVTTGPNCPVLEVTVQSSARSTADNEGCRSFAPATLTYLWGADPGVVVLSAADSYWTDSAFSVGADAAALTSDTSRKLSIARSAIDSTVRGLQARGHRVLVVGDIPRWAGEDEWAPADCTVLALLTGAGSCERRMPVARVEARQGAVRDLVRDVTAATGSRFVDPWPRLCPGGSCATHGDGTTRYRDTNHISVPQSAAFAPDFRDAIELLE